MIGSTYLVSGVQSSILLSSSLVGQAGRAVQYLVRLVHGLLLVGALEQARQSMWTC